MSIFDVIVFGVIGVLTIIGIWKGLVRQLFGFAGLIAGYMLAMRFYGPCSRYLMNFSPGTAKAVSFIAILIACILIAHIIGWAVEKLFALSGLGFFNRFGGGFLGFLKGCIIIAVVVMVITSFLPANNRFFKKSYTIKYIFPVISELKKVTREDIKTRYNEKTGKEKSTLPGQKQKSTP